MMRQWTVDAFAAGPFKGNPACVVEPFDVWPDDGWMQALAAENNQAETAFLLKTAEPGQFGLRWMTPTVEVPLCGHATLASAHVLLSELGVAVDTLRFETRKSGALSVRRLGDGYEMDFPAPRPVRIDTPAGFAEALGAEPLEVWRAAYLLAILADETAVRNLKPDLAKVEQVCVGEGCERGNALVSAVADAGSGYDVVSRFFAPGSGIPEDPATGSAHCIIAALFCEKLGRLRLKCFQAYPGRGGDLDVELKGDRVALAGQAVTVVESRLRL